jgi:hypothetical protein
MVVSELKTENQTMLFKIFTVLALLGLASQLSNQVSHNKESSTVVTQESQESRSAVVTHVPFFIPPPGTSGNYIGNDGSHADWDKYRGNYIGNDGSHADWDKYGGHYIGNDGSHMDWNY